MVLQFTKFVTYYTRVYKYKYKIIYVQCAGGYITSHYVHNLAAHLKMYIDYYSLFYYRLISVIHITQQPTNLYITLIQYVNSL